MDVDVRGQRFEFSDQIRDDERLRPGFNALTRETYGFDFETWYQNGNWGDRYQPYVLAKDGKVVANVSLNRMEVVLEGRRVALAQIGTVMTAPAFRHQGLSAYLMGRVLEAVRREGRPVFLFANDSVLDFYPKFGFVRGTETQCVIPLRQGGQSRFRRLDMNREENRARVLSLYGAGQPFSALYEVDNPGLMMFYLESFMKDCVYELECGALAVAEREGDVLLLHAVLNNGHVDLFEAARQVADANTLRVCLGFSPKDRAGFQQEPFKEEDSTLFWLDGKKPQGFEGLRIPQLSHA